MRVAVNVNVGRTLFDLTSALLLLSYARRLSHLKQSYGILYRMSIETLRHTRIKLCKERRQIV